MDWGLAKVLDQGGVADEERAIRASDGDSAVRTLRSGSEAMESRAGLGARHAVVHGTRAGPGRAGHARRAGGRLRPGLDPLRDPHRPAGVRGRRPRPRSTARRSGPTCRTRAHASTRATPTRSWWGWRGRAWPPRRSTGRGTRAMVVAGLTAYLRGVERRLREAELAQARAEARAAGERRRRLLTLALAGVGARDRADRRGRMGLDGPRAAATRASDPGRGRCGPRRGLEEARPGSRRRRGRPGRLGRGDRGRPPRRIAPRRRRRGPRAERAGDRLPGRTGPRARRGRGRREGPPDRRAARRDPQRPRRPQRRSRRPTPSTPPPSAPTVSTSTGSEPEAAGRALAASPAVADLANALDQWAFLRRGPVLRDPAGGARLVAAARTADPDPWRNRLRDTLGRMGGDPARRLEALERLAATADVDHLPVASVTRLAAVARVPRPERHGDRAPAAGPGVAPR